MQGLHKVLNIPEYGWIMPEHTVLTLAKVLNMPGQRYMNMPPVLNIPGFRIWQCCRLHKVLNMPE